MNKSHIPGIIWNILGVKLRETLTRTNCDTFSRSQVDQVSVELGNKLNYSARSPLRTYQRDTSRHLRSQNNLEDFRNLTD